MSAKVLEINELILAYRDIAPILKQTSHALLNELVESWDTAIDQLLGHLNNSMNDAKQLTAIRAGLREGLRELPEMLNATKGVEDPQALIAAIELKLGKPLTQF